MDRIDQSRSEYSYTDSSSPESLLTDRQTDRQTEMDRIVQTPEGKPKSLVSKYQNQNQKCISLSPGSKLATSMQRETEFFLFVL